MRKIEEKFYKCFGIEPKMLCFNGDCAVKDEIGYDKNICDDRCVYIAREYPPITDRVLLKMMCITLNSFDYPKIKNIEHMKLKTLLFLIKLIKENEYYGYEILKKNLIKKVRKLFEEGE